MRASAYRSQIGPKSVAGYFHPTEGSKRPATSCTSGKGSHIYRRTKTVSRAGNPCGTDLGLLEEILVMYAVKNNLGKLADDVSLK
jgi:hypothetical protein